MLPASFLHLLLELETRRWIPCPVGQVCPVRLGRVGRSVSAATGRASPQAVEATWHSVSVRLLGSVLADRGDPAEVETMQVLDGLTRWEAAGQVRRDDDLVQARPGSRRR